MIEKKYNHKLVILYANEWCAANGYPVKSYQHRAASNKLQAASVKPQAASYKRLNKL